MKVYFCWSYNTLAATGIVEAVKYLSDITNEISMFKKTFSGGYSPCWYHLQSLLILPYLANFSWLLFPHQKHLLHWLLCSVLGYFHIIVVFVVLSEKSEIFALGWRVIFSSLKVMRVNVFPVGNNWTITLDNKHNVWKNEWKTARIVRMFSKAWKYFISTFLLHRKRK